MSVLRTILTAILNAILGIFRRSKQEEIVVDDEPMPEILRDSDDDMLDDLGLLDYRASDEDGVYRRKAGQPHTGPVEYESKGPQAE